MLLSFGALVSLMLGGGDAGITASNPGLNKLVTAGDMSVKCSHTCFTLLSVFPIGLVAIILTGAELVTSNMCIFMMAHVKRKVPWYAGIVNVSVVTLGNLIGSLIIAGLIGKSSGVFSSNPYRAYVISFATTKIVTPTWGMILVRGIGCNFLVCIAVYQATTSREVIGKIVGAYLPIFIFVALAMDHVVANMLFIPLALMLGANFGTGFYIWKSFIPSFIGNLIGAAFFAIPMTIAYLFNDAPLLPSFTRGSGGAETPTKKSDGSTKVSLVD